MKPPPVNNFALRLRREWRVLKLPAKKQTFVVAASGGADSSALVAALSELKISKKLDLSFVVAHFNHQLRGTESEADAEFVEKLAARFEFKFVGGKWLHTNRKENLEQAARHARYQFLIEVAEKQSGFAVLTGHTLNDQAETFLMRLLRGSSLDGLGGMRSMRAHDKETQGRRDAERFSENVSASLRPCVSASQILLVRPLLSWAKREMTEEYCRLRGIDFRQDSMNEDKVFFRVRVRRELLPLLQAYNPKIIEQLSQTSFLLGEDAEELNLGARKTLESCLIDSSLDANFLKKCSAAMRRRVIRIWLKTFRGSLKRIEAKHLEAIDRLLLEGEGNSFIELPAGGIVIKKKNLLIFEADKG